MENLQDRCLEAFPLWLNHLPDDVRSLVGQAMDPARPLGVRRWCVAAASYVLRVFDLVSDGIEDLGYLEGAFVCRVAAQRAASAAAQVDVDTSTERAVAVEQQLPATGTSHVDVPTWQVEALGPKPGDPEGGEPVAGIEASVASEQELGGSDVRVSDTTDELAAAEQEPGSVRGDPLRDLEGEPGSVQGDSGVEVPGTAAARHAEPEVAAADDAAFDALVAGVPLVEEFLGDLATSFEFFVDDLTETRIQGREAGELLADAPALEGLERDVLAWADAYQAPSLEQSQWTLVKLRAFFATRMVAKGYG